MDKEKMAIAAEACSKGDVDTMTLVQKIKGIHTSLKTFNS